MRNSRHSLHALLRQFLLRNVICLVLPVCVLGSLLLSLTLRYGTDIALTTRASEVRAVLMQDLPDEVWKVVSGRISVEEGRQRVLIDNTLYELNDMVRRVSDEEAQYLNAALRAIHTIDGYVDQLETQMDAGAAVSRNESLYREIHSVSHLAGSMLDRYIENEIEHMGRFNAGIQRGLWLAALAVIALVAGMIVLSIRASGRLEDNIGASLYQLEQFANRIAAGELAERVPPAEIDELYLLTRDLNTMAERLGTLIHERVEQEKTLKKAELRALQAQITPHFMYNTLETIVWLAEEGRNSEVVEMTMAFTGFLRISLSRGADYITVEREEQHVASYLQIQSVRYGSIMRYTIDIDPALRERHMLKIVLQPLVENAIYHGIKRKRGRGRLTVIGRALPNGMYFAVEDDGMGMTPERLAEVRAALRNGAPLDPEGRGGYGLRNVEQRLRLYYGCGLTIESEYRHGTRISFTVPDEQEEKTL